MTLNAYLSFRDNARAALEFYQSALGGELSIDTFESYPDMGHDPSENNLVMHGQLTLPDGQTLMASDTPSTMVYEKPQGFSVSFSGPDDTTLRAVWDALAEGGTITMPLDTPPWGGLFGMLVDRFGIAWMVASGEG